MSVGPVTAAAAETAIAATRSGDVSRDAGTAAAAKTAVAAIAGSATTAPASTITAVTTVATVNAQVDTQRSPAAASPTAVTRSLEAVQVITVSSGSAAVESWKTIPGVKYRAATIPGTTANAIAACTATAATVAALEAAGTWSAVSSEAAASSAPAAAVSAVSANGSIRIERGVLDYQPSTVDIDRAPRSQATAAAALVLVEAWADNASVPAVRQKTFDVGIADGEVACIANREGAKVQRNRLRMKSMDARDRRRNILQCRAIGFDGDIGRDHRSRRRPHRVVGILHRLPHQKHRASGEDDRVITVAGYTMRCDNLRCAIQVADDCQIAVEIRRVNSLLE